MERDLTGWGLGARLTWRARGGVSEQGASARVEGPLGDPPPAQEKCSLQPTVLVSKGPEFCPLTFSCASVWLKMVWSVLLPYLASPWASHKPAQPLGAWLSSIPEGPWPPPPKNSAVKRKKGDVREKGGNKVFGKQRVLQPQVLWKQFRNNLLPAQLLSAPPAAHPVWPAGFSLPESQPPPPPSRSLMAESW